MVADIVDRLLGAVTKQEEMSARRAAIEIFTAFERLNAERLSTPEAMILDTAQNEIYVKALAANQESEDYVLAEADFAAARATIVHARAVEYADTLKWIKRLYGGDGTAVNRAITVLKRHHEFETARLAKNDAEAILKAQKAEQGLRNTVSRLGDEMEVQNLLHKNSQLVFNHKTTVFELEGPATRTVRGWRISLKTGIWLLGIGVLATAIGFGIYLAATFDASTPNQESAQRQAMLASSTESDKFKEACVNLHASATAAEGMTQEFL